MLARLASLVLAAVAVSGSPLNPRQASAGLTDADILQVGHPFVASSDLVDVSNVKTHLF